MRFDPKNPVLHQPHSFPDSTEALVARCLILCRVFVRAAKAQRGKPVSATALAHARRSHERLLELLPQLDHAKRTAFHAEASSLGAEIFELTAEFQPAAGQSESAAGSLDVDGSTAS